MRASNSAREGQFAPKIMIYGGRLDTSGSALNCTFLFLLVLKKEYNTILILLLKSLLCFPVFDRVAGQLSCGHATRAVQK